MLRLIASLCLCATLIMEAQAEEARDLFNGKDLTGWVAEGATQYKDKSTGEMRPVWSVQEGLLVCNGSGFGFLRYGEKEYSDFAFHVEYRMAPKCNSGIGIRTPVFDPKKSTATRPSYGSYEIQLLDDAGKPPNDHGSASLYRYVAPRKNLVKPAGEWNTIDIECVGPRIKIAVNGEEVINVDQTTRQDLKDKPLKGYVCLQNHGHKIEFRSVRLREIKPAAAP